MVKVYSSFIVSTCEYHSEWQDYAPKTVRLTQIGTNSGLSSDQIQYILADRKRKNKFNIPTRLLILLSLNQINTHKKQGVKMRMQV